MSLLTHVVNVYMPFIPALYGVMVFPIVESRLKGRSMNKMGRGLITAVALVAFVTAIWGEYIAFKGMIIGWYLWSAYGVAFILLACPAITVWACMRLSVTNDVQEEISIQPPLTTACAESNSVRLSKDLFMVK